MENTIEKLQKKINRLEKDIQESKVQYKNVVNSLFAGIAIHINNKIVFANRALIDLTGESSEDDFLGKNIIEFVHPEDRKKVTEIVTKAFPKPKSDQKKVSDIIEKRLIKTDGSEIIAEFSAVLIDYYGEPALMVMINDITERKQTREILKHRLIALTQPIGKVKELKLTDIIDVDILQELQDSFAESYNVAALIYDKKGNPVTKPSNFSDFCSLIRSTEKGMQRCKRSKVNISNLISGGSPVADTCTVFKEVFEGATPIFLENRYVGTWGIGQKLSEKIPEKKLRDFAKEIDIDEDEFVAAANKLKIGTKEQFKQAVSFLNVIAKDVAILGLQNIQQAREISNRKQAEEELQKKGRQLRQIIDTVPHMIFAKDRDGRFIMANKTVAEAQGITPEKMTGKTHPELSGATTEEYKSYLADDREVIDSGKLKFIPEEDYTYPDGHKVILETIKIPFTTAGIPAVLGVSVDITERKKMENKLTQKNTELKSFVNNIPDMAWLKDRNSNFIIANKAFSNAVGMSLEYLTNQTCEVCFGKEAAEKFKEGDIKVMEGKKQVMFEEKVKDAQGNLVNLETIKSPIFSEPGDVIGTVGIARDITKRKKAEEELRESEQKFRDTANLLPQIIYETDITGNLTFVNKQAFESFGYSQEEFEKGINVMQVIIPEDIDKAKEDIQKILCGKVVEYPEYIALRKDGSTFPILIYSSAIIRNNKPVGMRGIIIDITERKQAEEQLAAQNEEYASLNEEYQSQNQELISALGKAEESDRLKTEFINNMSHEIRTPMNGILGFSEFLNKPDLSDKKRKYYVNIIQNSGNQLMQIIDDILEISELGTKQVKAQNINVCLNDLLLELFSIFDIKAKENKTPLYLRKGLSDKESTIYTDETKLNKILSNLLVNALKFTNVGFIEFGYRLINNSIEIYVKDTGIGINTDKQETIFERFSQEEKELSRKVGGLGLGLSIAKENAELIGGKITLKSEKGKGTTFFITIPYKPVNLDIEKSNLCNEKENITKKQDKYTILIVEDEEVNSLYIETLLKDIIEIQCNIIHSKNGKEAVDLCKTNSEIDIVLMDLKMSIMNGHEATKLIKEFRPGLSIVAQTAYSTKEDKEKAISAGCDDFISKPINEETLNEIINKYLIKK